MIEKKYFGELAQLYEEVDGILLINPKEVFGLNRFYAINILYPLIYDSLFLPKNILCGVKHSLGLEDDEVRPNFPKIFDQEKNRKKRLIISPFATSCTPCMSNEDWLVIAQLAKRKGFEVFFNAPKGVFDGFECDLLPIKEFLSFCSESTHFIGYRSGLCDVVASFTPIKMLIVYPNNRKKSEFNCIKDYDLDPNNVANYYNMAMVYKLQGQLNDSKQWFEKVLEKDPSNTWSVYGIATIYADQGDDTKALDWLEKAIKIDPSVKAVAAEQDHFERFHNNGRFKTLVEL